MHNRGRILKYLNQSIAALLLLLGVAASAQEQEVTENDLIAALSYNFARYTTWPENSNLTVFNFCVLADTALDESFNKLGDRKVGNLNIKISTVQAGDNLNACRLLYIDHRDKQQTNRALEAVKQLPVLTIGQQPDFISSGGIINLFKENGRYRFEINIHRAQRADLQISARLLQIATVVGEQ